MNWNSQRRQAGNEDKSAASVLVQPECKSVDDKIDNAVWFHLTTSLHGLQKQMNKAKNAEEDCSRAKLAEEIRLERTTENRDNILDARGNAAEEVKKRYNNALRKANRLCGERHAHYEDAKHLHKVHQDVFQIAEKLVFDAQELYGTTDIEKIVEGQDKYFNHLLGSKAQVENSINQENLPKNLSKLRDVCPEHVHLWLLPGFKSSFTTEEVEELEEWTGHGLFGKRATDKEVEEKSKKIHFKSVADVIKSLVSSEGYVEKFGRKGMEMMEELAKKGLILRHKKSPDSIFIKNLHDADGSKKPHSSDVTFFKTSGSVTSTSSASSTSGIEGLRKRRAETWDPLDYVQKISRK